MNRTLNAEVARLQAAFLACDEHNTERLADIAAQIEALRMVEASLASERVGA